MNISRLIFNSCLGMASILSLSTMVQAQNNHPTEPLPAKEQPHKHIDGEDHDHDHDHDHEADSKDDDHDHEASKGLADIVPVHIDAKAIHALDMKIEKVVAQPHAATKSYYGQLEIPPSAVQTFSLPSSGRVIPHVQSAQKVKKGDVLYTLESPDIVDLAGKVRDAEASLKRAEAELLTLTARRDQLEKIGTRNSELDTSIRFKEAEIPGLRSTLETARNQFQIATSGGTMEGNLLVVRAPIDGSVQSVDTNHNAWEEQGVPILVMTEPGKLEFKATAYASDSLRHSAAHLVLTSPDGKKSIILNGTTRISAQINPENQTRTIYFVPDKVPTEAYAGQVARLELNEPADAREGFISVPNSAIVKVGINDVVFLRDKDDDDLFLMVKVETLPSRRGMTPVKGIKEGQLLVTQGGYELKYVLPEGNGPKKAAGHFHADGKFHEGEH